MRRIFWQLFNFMFGPAIKCAKEGCDYSQFNGYPFCFNHMSGNSTKIKCIKEGCLNWAMDNLVVCQFHQKPVADGNPKDIAARAKPPLALVPPALTLYVSKAMETGAKKYGPYNWRSTKVKHTVYLEAALRHILAALDGQKLDPESGIPHEAHAAACMGIILDARETATLINDLPPKGPAAEIIAQMTEKKVEPVKTVVCKNCGRTIFKDVTGRYGHTIATPNNFKIWCTDDLASQAEPLEGPI